MKNKYKNTIDKLATLKKDNLYDKKEIKEVIESFEEINGGKVIYLTQTGSVLHGTHSDKSDIDLKGIYVPNIKEVILQNYKPVISLNTSEEKNSNEDVDIEFYSIFDFLTLVSKMETNALEILFSMFSNMYVYKTKEVELIKSNKDKLINRHIHQFIGFAMSMASRYSVKGERYQEVDDIKAFFEEKMKDMSKREMKTLPISSFQEELEEFCKTKKYISIVEADISDGRKGLYLQVLKSKYQLTNKVIHVFKGIQTIGFNFGKRAEKAKENKGVDYKAYAHAFRAIWEAKELLTTGFIQFPLSYAEELKKIKFNNSLTRLELSNLMEKEYEELMELSKNSNQIVLNEKSDFETINNIKLLVYGQ